MDPYALRALTLMLSAVLSLAAYKFSCLTRNGAIAAFVVAGLVGAVGSFRSFLLLMAFASTGFAVTRMDFKKKERDGVQEGTCGERDWKNIVGVSVAPCAVVLLNSIHPLDPELFAILFVSAIAVSGADTVASEIGVRDPDAYLITTFEPVKPGTNGGVSKIGTLVSSVASLVIAVLGWAFLMGGLDFMLLIPFAAGIAGNLLDSFFGAILENRGYISKYINNGSTSMLGSAIGGFAWLAIV